MFNIWKAFEDLKLAITALPITAIASISIKKQENHLAGCGVNQKSISNNIFTRYIFIKNDFRKVTIFPSL